MKAHASSPKFRYDFAVIWDVPGTQDDDIFHIMKSHDIESGCAYAFTMNPFEGMLVTGTQCVNVHESTTQKKTVYVSEPHVLYGRALTCFQAGTSWKGLCQDGVLQLRLFVAGTIPFARWISGKRACSLTWQAPRRCGFFALTVFV